MTIYGILKQPKNYIKVKMCELKENYFYYRHVILNGIDKESWTHFVQSTLLYTKKVISQFFLKIKIKLFKIYSYIESCNDLDIL